MHIDVELRDNIYVELRSGVQELIAGVCKKYSIKTRKIYSILTIY